MKPFSDTKLQELFDCCEKFGGRLYDATNDGKGVLANLTCKEVYNLDSFNNLFDEWLDTDYISNEEVVSLYEKCRKEFIPAKIFNVIQKIK